MSRDRAFYLDCLKQMVKDNGGIVEKYYDILSRPDEIERHWWTKSVSETNVHEAMVACSWEPTGVVESLEI